MGVLSRSLKLPRSRKDGIWSPGSQATEQSVSLCASAFVFFGILAGPTSSSGGGNERVGMHKAFNRSRQTARVCEVGCTHACHRACLCESHPGDAQSAMVLASFSELPWHRLWFWSLTVLSTFLSSFGLSCAS